MTCSADFTPTTDMKYLIRKEVIDVPKKYKPSPIGTYTPRAPYLLAKAAPDQKVTSLKNRAKNTETVQTDAVDNCVLKAREPKSKRPNQP